MNSAVAKPAIAARNRRPHTAPRIDRLGCARRDHDQTAILNQPQDRPVRGRPQRPLPVIAWLVRLAPLCGQPCSRIEQRVQRKVYDRLRAGSKLKISSQGRHKERRSRTHLILAGNQIRDQVAPVEVGECGSNHHRVLSENLNQRAHLSHALSIANNAGDRSTRTRGSAGNGHRQYHGQKRDFHLGSLHSFDTWASMTPELTRP